MMSWSKVRPNSRLMSLSLPKPIAAQLIKEKARSGKSMTGIISEALMRMWQSQGVMAPSPIPDVPARYFTPPMVYPPQTVGVAPPSCRAVPSAVVPNPADQAVREVVTGGRYKGMVRQSVNPKVPEWDL